MSDRTLSIMGRVNVGKSTLFNRLCRSRSAIVEDTPGVTRDRKDGRFSWSGHSFILCDTGGLDPDLTDSPAVMAQKQAILTLEFADLVIFVVDARAGLLTEDYQIADTLRKSGKPVILVANKVDVSAVESMVHEFHSLGLGTPMPISAEHNIGIDDLKDEILSQLNLVTQDDDETVPSEDAGPRIAIVGRPNVGKSSFINAILGEDRHIVTDIPGTTRDSVDSLYRYNDKQYCFIDTAGLRRIGKTKEKLDKIASIMAMKSIERCDIAILLIDASQEITQQDAHVAGYILKAGKGCIIAANKWDLTERTQEYYQKLKENIQYKLAFLSWAPVITFSALTKDRVFKIFSIIDRVVKNMTQEIPTSALNRILQDAQKYHTPPRRDHNHMLKFYYAAQVYKRPPTFLIFTNTHRRIHFSYERYLINRFREEFDYEGCPIRLVMRHKHD